MDSAMDRLSLPSYFITLWTVKLYSQIRQTQSLPSKCIVNVYESTVKVYRQSTVKVCRWSLPSKSSATSLPWSLQ